MGEDSAMQIDQERYDLAWRAVETMSTNAATDYAIDHGIRPPTDERAWTLGMEYTPDGEERLVWDRAIRVVIDPAGFHYDGPTPGPPAIEVDQATYARVWETIQDMESAYDIADYVRAEGIEPPDDSPDWEVYVDSVTGRPDERPVWYRAETVPITPAAPADAS